MLKAVLIVVIALVGVPSQPPIPGAGIRGSGQPQQQPARAQEQPTTDPRGTTQTPLIVKVQPTAETDEETAKKQAEENAQASAQGWTKVGIVLTGIVGLLTLVILGFQAAIAGRQNAIMRTQSTIMTGQANAAANSAIAAADVLATNREIERAYVAIKFRGARHIQGRPELQGRPERPAAVKYIVEARNFGRTPGSILGGFVGFSIGRNPTDPDMARIIKLTPAFLLPDGHIEFEGKVSVEDDVHVEAILRGTDGHRNIWIIGQVDYADRFGGLHKGGFGRCFKGKRLLFTFTAETAPFNYDRPLTQEERAQYKEMEQPARSRATSDG